MSRLLLSGCSALTGLLLAACQQAPIAPLRANDMRASEEIFAIFCKRLARDGAPNDPDGTQFSAACDEGEAASLADTRASPALRAFVDRRGVVVEALDRVLGVGTARDPLLPFAKAQRDGGELDQFLYRLVPFYDRAIPALTRGAAGFAQELAANDDEQARAIRVYFEGMAARRGYRAPSQGVSGVRAALAYPRLDPLLRALTSVVADGAGGEAAFRALLASSALELADQPSGIPPAEDWLASGAEVLLREVAAPDADAKVGGELARYAVLRGGSGAAQGAGSTPFPVPGSTDPDAVARLPDGRLPSFRYRDATHTLLATLLRSTRELWTPGTDGTRALLALASSVAPLLGPTAARSYTFLSGREVQRTGFDLSQAPMIDLVHALATVLALPETDALLAVLRELLRNQESSLLGVVHLALEIDRIAADFPEAAASGWDGTTDTRTELWDDLIAYIQGLSDRPGMLEAVVRSYSKPSAVAQLALLAKLMKHNDRVSYPGPRVVAEQVHSETDAARYNAPIAWQLASPVDRTRPDYGMNRSLFQRLLSTVGSVVGVPFCNKDGAYMSVPDPTNPEGTLAFPNPSGQPGANPLLTGILELVCPPSSQALSYARCALVEHPNIAEAHMRTILGRLELKLKDAQIVCLTENGLAGDLGAQQETLSQLQGYSLRPTAQAFTRFTYVGPNRFVSNLSATQLTKDGVPVVDFEPDYSFVLEAKQDDVILDGKPASFMDISKDIATAFDDHEYFEDTPNGKVATRGYRYAELLALLHMHWPSPRTTDCLVPLRPGDEGCSQRLDPARPFYSKQSNLVSYEPLLIRAQQELRLGELAQGALAAIANVWVAVDGRGAPRVVAANSAGAKDGIAVLADFILALIAPRDAYAYRDGHRETSTNACALGKDAATGQLACQNGRGRVLAQTSPIYLVLDALHAMDVAWARPENAARYGSWLAGRSRLVDELLAVEVMSDAGKSPTFRLRDRRLRAAALNLLDWLVDDLLDGRHPLAGDRWQWATGDHGLARRLEAVLSHPLVYDGLELLTAITSHPAATAELSAMLAHFTDADAHPETFADVALAAVDSLEYASHEPNPTPLARLLARALAANAEAAIAPEGPAPDVAGGSTYTGTALLRDIVQLPAYQGASPSPLAKLLSNLVARDAQGQTPLEVLFDATVEVDRLDPAQPKEAALTAPDVQRVLSTVAQFLRDPERGLERLYAVIASRNGNTGARP